MVVVDGVEMVDVQEAPRIAHRTPETIRRWVWSGRVRSIKQGNRLLVPRADLDEASSGAGMTPRHHSRCGTVPPWWPIEQEDRPGSARGT